MNNIFLAPNGTSIEYTRKNFDSVLYGRSYNSIEPFLNPKEKEILSKHKSLRVWGVKGWFWPTWFRIKPDDFILFYARKNFCYSAKVIMTKDSQELAGRLWLAGEEYKYMFFIDDLKETNIPLEVINKLAGYGLKKLEPFIPLNDRGLKAIKEKFGSIENFVDKHILSLKSKKIPHGLFAKIDYFFYNYFKTV